MATTRQYSDKLLMFLLKGHMPEKYGDRLRLEAAVDAKTQELAERYGLSVQEVETKARKLLRATD